jgi:hypothetical protein
VGRDFDLSWRSLSAEALGSNLGRFGKDLLAGLESGPASRNFIRVTEGDTLLVTATGEMS